MVISPQLYLQHRQLQDRVSFTVSSWTLLEYPVFPGGHEVSYKGKYTGFMNPVIQPTFFSLFLLSMRRHRYYVTQAGIPVATLNSLTPILAALPLPWEARVVRPVGKTGCPK